MLSQGDIGEKSTSHYNAPTLKNQAIPRYVIVLNQKWRLKMVRCKSCGQELADKRRIVSIDVSIDGKKIEIESGIHDFGIAFKDIKIPKGWRLPTLSEGVWIFNNLRKEIFKKDYSYFYIEQFIDEYKGKYAAWLGCYDYYFILNTYDDLDNLNAARGVLFVRGVKKNGGKNVKN